LEPEARSVVKALVNNGQLSFANGGWCMHDEASTHYISMIDQTTHGHQFLHKELDYLPRVGWQIDPFGHSATQAALLSSEVGFDSLFFGRIDYQDHKLRKAARELEFIWRPSPSLPDALVFTGVFSDGNYGPPATFCFDAACSDDPIILDVDLPEYNADDVVARFATATLREHNMSRGSHIAFKMGSDFHYTNAHMWFV
jgi:alpha-mannosidase